MKPEIKKFIQSGEKIIIIECDSNKDAISNWRKVRNPLKSLFNYTVNGFSNIMFSFGLNKLFLQITGIKIGKNVGIAPLLIDPLFPELITIGNNSNMGWKTKILTHEFTRNEIRLGRVNIGNNVMVGAFSLIRSGVSIGNNSIIAMNSYVNKDIPANEIWGGVPAKRIQKLNKKKK